MSMSMPVRPCPCPSVHVHAGWVAGWLAGCLAGWLQADRLAVLASSAGCLCWLTGGVAVLAHAPRPTLPLPYVTPPYPTSASQPRSQPAANLSASQESNEAACQLQGFQFSIFQFFNFSIFQFFNFSIFQFFNFAIFQFFNFSIFDKPSIFNFESKDRKLKLLEKIEKLKN